MTHGLTARRWLDRFTQCSTSTNLNKNIFISIKCFIFVWRKEERKERNKENIYFFSLFCLKKSWFPRLFQILPGFSRLFQTLPGSVGILSEVFITAEVCFYWRNALWVTSGPQHDSPHCASASSVSWHHERLLQLICSRSAARLEKHSHLCTGQMKSTKLLLLVFLIHFPEPRLNFRWVIQIQSERWRKPALKCLHSITADAAADPELLHFWVCCSILYWSPLHSPKKRKNIVILSHNYHIRIQSLRVNISFQEKKIA